MAIGAIVAPVAPCSRSGCVAEREFVDALVRQLVQLEVLHEIDAVDGEENLVDRTEEEL